MIFTCKDSELLYELMESGEVDEDEYLASGGNWKGKEFKVESLEELQLVANQYGGGGIIVNFKSMTFILNWSYIE